MHAILILSGAPASGKTTLSRRLAQASARGVHLDTDRFYDFIPALIPPVQRESQAQNEAIATACARAAAAFAERGYEVFVDGVIGPWFVPIWTRELGAAGVPLDYAVLRAPLELTLRRSSEREKNVDDAVVRQMHAQFASLGPFERHAIETGERSPAETLAEIARRRARGELRVAGG